MDKQLLEQFVDAIIESGLSEDRQRHWVRKMEHGNFGPADARAFMEELSEYALQLDDAIKRGEADVALKEEKLRKAKIAVLPFVQKLSEEQPALMEHEAKQYKKAIQKEEHEMMVELKGVREVSTADDIEAIRRKLAGG